MSGISQFNFPAFDEASEKLRAAGFDVFSPAEHDREMGFDSTYMSGNEVLEGEYTLRNMFHADTGYICQQAEAICLLPGWKNSKGATAELALARALGLWAGSVEDFLEDALMPADEVFRKAFCA